MTNSVSPSSQHKAVIVPTGVTIGLVVFAVVLALVWMGLSIWSWAQLGQAVTALLPKVLLICAFFLIALPLGFVIGARGVNRFSGKPPIYDRNALTLGLLISCVTMLWVMSVYS